MRHALDIPDKQNPIHAEEVVIEEDQDAKADDPPTYISVDLAIKTTCQHTSALLTAATLLCSGWCVSRGF